MGTLFVDKLDPQSGTALEIGSSGDTMTVPSGATFNVAGTLQSGGAAIDNTPAFQAFKAANQTISATTYTKIQFDTEDYDTDGCYNNTGSTVTLNGISTPSYSFAPNVAGKYLIGGAVNSNTSTDFDTLLVSIFKNGTQVNRVINSSRHFDTAMTSFIVTANGTSDYFDIQCYSELSGGTTLQPTDGASRLMWFCATKLIGV
jgi:hypothetical protein